MISEWTKKQTKTKKNCNVLWHTPTTLCYYWRRKLNFPCLFRLFVCLFFTIYIHYIFIRAFFKWNSSRDKQLRKKKKAIVLVLGVISSPTPALCSALVDVALLPPKEHRPTLEAMRNAGVARYQVQQKAEVRGQASLFEAGVGTRSMVQWLGGSEGVSEESRNWGLRSLHWPGCLSGPPRTACAAAGRSNSDRGSSCSAVSSFCWGWGPLPLGVSGIAAGSERDVHLERRRKGER